jgi:hypothetical protein
MNRKSNNKKYLDKLIELIDMLMIIKTEEKLIMKII